MLIDTHCHLHDREWFTPEQQVEFLEGAHSQDVEKIICIGTTPEDSKNACNFAANHKNVYWTYGIHPEFASQPDMCAKNDLSFFSGIRSHDERGYSGVLSSFEIMKLDFSGRRGSDSLEEESVPLTEKEDKNPQLPIAIGEIGLDYHYDGYDRAAQIKLFEQMLQLALDLNLPVSLHLREAFADAFAVLDNFPQIQGVIHSFTGSKRDLKAALSRGFYIGVNGLATYTTPPPPPLERIVLETDAPFLTPVPMRGKINQPGYVAYVATYLADKLGIKSSIIREETTKNARKIFQI